MDKRRIAKPWLWVLAIALLLLVIFSIPYLRVVLSGFKTTINSHTKRFKIEKPMEVRQLVDQLLAEKIIDSPSDFLRVAAYKEIGKAQIALGMYQIKPGTNYRTLLNGFKRNSKGNGNAEIEVNVMFNHSNTLPKLCGEVAKCILADSVSLIRLLKDSVQLKAMGIPFTYAQLPALFIPNSYSLFYDTDAKGFIQKMFLEYQRFWTKNRLVKLKAIGLSHPYEASTLASIVYAEQSKKSDEWPIIAGLYLNRLKQRMPLQSDPTFKFCWGDKLKGVQRLLNEHRDIDCPYNTYKVTGLPPGPINFPSGKVMDAVLQAQKNNFLYMCAKPDYSRRHNFADNYAIHQQNAKAFQQWIAIELKRKNAEK